MLSVIGHESNLHKLRQFARNIYYLLISFIQIEKTNNKFKITITKSSISCITVFYINQLYILKACTAARLLNCAVASEQTKTNDLHNLLRIMLQKTISARK